MNFIISGRNIDVTPGLKDAIISKLSKLERYFTPDTEIIVTLSVEKERQKITSISRSQAWKLEREGKFPPRKTIGKKSCGWLLSDLLWWISQY